MENLNYKSKKIEKKNLKTLYDWLTNYTLEQIKKKKLVGGFKYQVVREKMPKQTFMGDERN